MNVSPVNGIKFGGLECEVTYLARPPPPRSDPWLTRYTAGPAPGARGQKGEEIRLGYLFSILGDEAPALPGDSVGPGVDLVSLGLAHPAVCLHVLCLLLLQHLAQPGHMLADLGSLPGQGGGGGGEDPRLVTRRKH